MRLFLAPAVLLGLIGGFQAINYVAAVPTAELTAAYQAARTIDVSSAELLTDPLAPRGLGSAIGRIAKGAAPPVKNKLKKPRPIAGGIADEGAAGGSASGAVDDVTAGAAQSTRTKGSVEDNIPGIGRNEDKRPPLADDNATNGKPKYLEGLVDANKDWTYISLYEAPAVPGSDYGNEFFRFAVDADQGAILLQQAYTKLSDEALDAARTYKTRDILFDGWLRECARLGRDPASLRIAIRNDISTPETQAAIDRAFAVAGKPRNEKAEFSFNSEASGEMAGFKILTEENVHGVGVAKMLQINALDVDNKQIVKLTAWTPEASPPNYYALAFEFASL